MSVTFFLPKSSKCQSLKATQYFKSKYIAVMHNLLDKVSPANRKKESQSEHVCVCETDREMRAEVGRIWAAAAGGSPRGNAGAGLAGEQGAPLGPLASS